MQNNLLTGSKHPLKRNTGKQGNNEMTTTALDQILAAEAAEDAKLLAAGHAKQAYYSLIADLLALENSLAGRPCLSHENVDIENALDGGDKYGTLEFWQACLRSAASAAGSRGEEVGLDVNALLGRSIY